MIASIQIVICEKVSQIMSATSVEGHSFSSDMAEFALQTAILAGDGTLELRVFASEDVAVSTEVIMTQQLCGAMNKYQRHWEE